MRKARQGQFRCATTTANLVFGLEHDHRAPSAGQGDGGGQAVWPRANHHRIISRANRHSLTNFYWLAAVRRLRLRIQRSGARTGVAIR